MKVGVKDASLGEGEASDVKCNEWTGWQRQQSPDIERQQHCLRPGLNLSIQVSEAGDFISLNTKYIFPRTEP